MAYKSSPRPTFDQPTLITYQNVTRYLWGDAEAGLVNDWIYLSSGKIHQLIFGFPAGEGFRHWTEDQKADLRGKVQAHLVMLNGLLGG